MTKIPVDAELLPCPFCGSHDLEDEHDDGQFWKSCRKCYASGPVAGRYDEGDPWNRRASPQDSAGAVAERDREADRKRFDDPDFNKWLDEPITESGEYTVWDQIGDACAAWYGWENRQYYVTPQSAGQAVEVAGEREALESKVPLYEAVERACGELPNGWTIELHMERGAGWVELYDVEGVEVKDFPTNNERLDYTVGDAIDAALAQTSGGV